MTAAASPDRATPDDARPTRPPRPAGQAGEPLWRHVLGEQLRRLRHERGQTLTDTATRAGVSPQYLSEMERGVKEPSSEMIAAVAGALDTTLIDLTSAVAERLRTISSLAASGPRCRAGYALAA
jgi:DNA-binding XRE family transcriptional regulator